MNEGAKTFGSILESTVGKNKKTRFNNRDPKGSPGRKKNEAPNS